MSSPDSRKFVTAFKIQINVIHALLLREVKTRFGRYRLGYVWALLEPLAFVVILSFVFGLRSRIMPEGVETPVFVITGIIPFLLFRNMLTRGMSVIDGNRVLFNYRQVKPLDALIARAVLEVVVYFVVFVISVIVAGWVGFDVSIENPLMVLTVFLSIGCLGLGLGAFAAVAVSFVSEVSQVVTLLQRPMFFLSGVFFTVDRLPHEVQPYLLWNPILHGLEIVREYYFTSVQTSHGEPAYLAWSSVVIFSLGMLTFHVNRDRLVTL